jgi:hypothetical protein
MYYDSTRKHSTEISSIEHLLGLGFPYKRFNINDDDSCSCGAEQTPEHFKLLECTWYSEARKEVRKNERTKSLQDVEATSHP